MLSYARFEKRLEKLCEWNTLEPSDVTEELKNQYNEDFFTKKIARTRCKSTKIVSNLFTPEYIAANFTNQDVELFSNQFAAAVRDELDFKIVKGEDIRKYYLKSNYEEDCPSGTLRGSCMAPSERQKFLDIYVNNENVSMLVAFSEGKKVIGRALVWDNVSFKERDSAQEVHKGQLMDRIYYTYDWIIDKFVKWAKERGIYTKNNQSHDDHYRFVNPKTNEVEEFYVDVEMDLRNEYLPYLDTMFIPNYKRGFITNKADGYDNNTQMRAHDSGKPRIVWDSIDGKPVESRDSMWSIDSKTWVHNNDSVKVDNDFFHKKLCFKDRLDGYITPKDTKVVCVVTGDEFAERNMINSEYHSGLIHKKESVETSDAGLVHKDHSVESKYLGTRLSKNGSIRLEKIDDYLPKSVLDNGMSVEDFEKVMETLNTIKGESGTTTNNFSESSTFVFEF